MVSFNKYVFLFSMIFLASCNKSYIAHVYSGVDPSVMPSKNDTIAFVMPDNPSIRERNLAVLLKDELVRSGFNIVNTQEASIWVISFSLDRNTYTIGSTSKSNGMAVGLGGVGVPLAVGSSKSKTAYNQQTDVTIHLHLFRTQDVRSEKPIRIWEGSVRTRFAVFSEYPNATIKVLLDQFGRNFEHEAKVYKNYQKGVDSAQSDKPL